MDLAPAAPSRFMPAGNTHRLEDMSSSQSMLRPVMTVLSVPTKRVRVQAVAVSATGAAIITAERAKAVSVLGCCFMAWLRLRLSKERGIARPRRCVLGAAQVPRVAG